MVRPAAACSTSPQAVRDRRPAQSHHNRPDMNTAAATTRAGLMFTGWPVTCVMREHHRECDAGVGVSGSRDVTVRINVVGRVFAQAYDTVAVHLILHATTRRRRHVRSLRSTIFEASNSKECFRPARRIKPPLIRRYGLTNAQRTAHPHTAAPNPAAESRMPVSRPSGSEETRSERRLRDRPMSGI
jgi:hypothetical protein